MLKGCFLLVNFEILFFYKSKKTLLYRIFGFDFQPLGFIGNSVIFHLKMSRSRVQFFSMTCWENALFCNKKSGNSEGKDQGNLKAILDFISCK